MWGVLFLFCAIVIFGFVYLGVLDDEESYTSFIQELVRIIRVKVPEFKIEEFLDAKKDAVVTPSTTVECEIVLIHPPFMHESNPPLSSYFL